MKRGYIKLYRSSLNSDMYFKEPFTKWQAWVDLLFIACWETNKVHRQGVRVDLVRGDIGWGEVELSKRWKWSRGKVRRFINELVSEKMLQRKQNNPRDKRTCVLSVCNYDTYQGCATTNSTGDSTGSSTRNGTGDGTEKKKSKNIKNNTPLPPGVVSELAETSKPRRKIIEDWITYRKEIKKPLKPTSIKSLIKTWADFSDEELGESVETSISNGWQGLFKPKDTKQSGSPSVKKMPKPAYIDPNDPFGLKKKALEDG